MAGSGLRERKKAETRLRIAETAARLFATRGFGAVTVFGVARAAGVAEKTVYNYFPTKEHLALDRDEEEISRIVTALRNRPARTAPARVIRQDALWVVSTLATIPNDQVLGTIQVLAFANPGIRNSCLLMFDRHADAIARELLNELPGRVSDGLRARMRAYAAHLSWIYMAIIDESGPRLARGDAPGSVARRVRPIIADVLNEAEQLRLPR